MTFIVNDACIKCKFTDCVAVCPVDCFYEGEHMLVIDPAVCIDCAVCVAECPVGAIEPESESNQKWVEFAKKKVPEYINIKDKRPHTEEALAFKGVEGKEKYLGEVV